jgi:hypothetical protein
MAYLYRHIRLDTMQPFYIGVGKEEKAGKYPRAYSHQNRNKHWHSIIKKVEYRIDILMEDLDYREAEEKEKEFIAIYGRANSNNGILCNLTDGGGGTLGVPISEEHKSRLSKFFTGKKLSESHLEKMRNYKFTEEHKLNLSNSQKGRIVSEETRLKISKTNKGHKMLPEQIEKMKISKRKSFELNGKHPISEETKKKIMLSQVSRIRLCAYYKDSGAKISEFESISECSKVIGVSEFVIRKVIRGGKTKMNYIFVRI